MASTIDREQYKILLYVFFTVQVSLSNQSSLCLDCWLCEHHTNVRTGGIQCVTEGHHVSMTLRPFFRSIPKLSKDVLCDFFCFEKELGLLLLGEDEGKYQLRRAP